MAEPGGCDPDSSLLTDLAHELRDALSAVPSSIDLLRIREFEPDAARNLAQTVERALRRTFVTVDAFILADRCETGTLLLDTAQTGLNDILKATREALPAELRERNVFVSAPANIAVNADLARTTEVLSALLQHAGAIALPGSTVEVRATAANPGAQIRVHARTDAQITPGEDWFRTYRGSMGGRMALRTARCIMNLQHGSLEVVARTPGVCELVATFSAGGEGSTAVPGSTTASVRRGASGA